MEFQRVVVEVGTDKFELREMTSGQAEKIFGSKQTDALQKNREMVVTCLNNADGGSRKVEEVGDWPFTVWKKVFPACLKLNGFDLEKDVKPGELEAAVKS